MVVSVNNGPVAQLVEHPDFKSGGSWVLMWTTYILQSEKNGSYYVGSTGDVEERLKRHNQGRSLSTKGKRPWKLVFQKCYYSKSEASRFEYYIKKQKSRKFIENVIQWAGSSVGRASAF